MIYHIFTDAAVNQITKNCGFAFVIITKQGEVMRKSGKLNIKHKNPTLAEVQSIANSLYCFSKIKIPVISKVIIHTDCLDFCNHFNDGFCKYLNKNISTKFDGALFAKAIEEIIFTMCEYCLKLGLNIRDYKKLFQVKHVKAHTEENTSIARLNDWCDKEAVKQRKLLDNAK